MTSEEKSYPPPSTAAELCLYLIMCLPEEKERILRIGDFCKLYEITEKRSIQYHDAPESLAAKIKGRMGGDI